MKRRAHTTLLAQILLRAAPKIGAKIVIEPEWKAVGQITFKNGTRTYFVGSSLGINSLGASKVSRDKDFASYFMQRMKYRIIPGQTFFSVDYCKQIGSSRNARAAYIYAQRIGFPVIVKPNSSSQGTDVHLVYTKKELFMALDSIFREDTVALVQHWIQAKDYRIVVLNNKIISAYERIPLSVDGNGSSTVLDLLRIKARDFIRRGRGTIIRVHDKRIASKLKRSGLTFRSVPRKGHRVFLLDNANLSSGGDAIDVTNLIHSDFKKIAINLTKDMGLRLCGVDIMVDGDITDKPKKYWILETNAAPGLDHYVKGGKAQEKIVEDMYLEVLKSMQQS